MEARGQLRPFYPQLQWNVELIWPQSRKRRSEEQKTHFRLLEIEPRFLDRPEPRGSMFVVVLYMFTPVFPICC
jgi:hypothetical protein